MKTMVSTIPQQQRLLQFMLWALLSFFPYMAARGQHQAPILFDLSDAPTQPSSEPKGLRAINGILYSQAFRGGGSDPDPYRAGTELFFNTDNPAQIFRPGSGAGPFPANVFSFLDIRPGPNDSNPTEFTSFLGRNYFFANPCIGPTCYGQVLFSTSGSSVDIVRIINPSPGSVSGGKNLTRVGNFLCFAASGGAAGEELWRSDGTTVGTQLVQDLNTNFVPPANTLDSYPRDLTAVGNRLFFTANDGTVASSRQLWVYDPTAGTSPGVNPRRVTTGLTFLDTQGSSNNLIAKDGLCFFLADPGGGVALFSSDGSTVNQLTNPATVVIDPNVPIANSSNVLFFAGTTAANGKELWSYDVSANLVRDLIPGTGSSNPNNLTDVNGTLFFAANVVDALSNPLGIELCKTDGTFAGTQMVSNLAFGSQSSSPREITNVDGVAYFVANGDVGGSNRGAEVWYSDGTANGTKIYIDLNTGTVDGVSPPIGAFKFGAWITPFLIQPQGTPPKGTGLFFAGFDGDNAVGNELWYGRPCPTYQLSYASNVLCQGIGSVLPSLQLQKGDATGLTGGTYSANRAGIVINATTGEINLNASTITPIPATPDTITFSADFAGNASKSCEGCRIRVKFPIVILPGGTSATRLVNTAQTGLTFQDATVEGSGDGPSGMAFSPDGAFLYIAETNAHRIRRIQMATNTMTIFAGSGTAGSADGTGAAAQFNFPAGLATDINGNIYVADKNNHTIRRITPGGVVSTIAGAVGVQGDVVDVTALSARFRFPADVAVDFNGNIYVADMQNNKVKRIDANNQVTNLAGDGSTTQLWLPSALRTDLLGRLFVVDRRNNQLKQINLTNGALSQIAGSTSGFLDNVFPTTGQMQRPMDVTVDPVGNIYIADRRNHIIRKVASSLISTEAGSGGSAGNTDNTIAPFARFNFPGGVISDLSGNLYVADNNNGRIRRVYTDNSYGVVNGSTFACGAVAGSLTLTGTTGTVIKWQRSSDFGVTWSDIVNATTTLNYTGLNLQETTLFRAVVQLGACPGISNYATVVVARPQGVTMQPPTILTNAGTQPRTVCGNGNVQFNATGGSNGSYRWYRRVGAGAITLIGGAVNNTHTEVVNATSWYYVSLVVGSCESRLDSVQIQVSPTPANPTASGARCGDGSVTLTANGAVGAEQYEWYSDAAGTTILKTSPDATDAVFATPSITTTTVYYVAIRNANCRSAIIAVNAVVNPNPTPVINPGNTSVCANATGVTYSVSTPVGANTYTWTITGGQITATNLGAITPATTATGVNANTITVTWGAAGAGTVNVQETTPPAASCSVTTPDVAITINAAPAPVIAGPNSACIGSTQTYSTPLVGGNDYVWAVTNGTIQSGQNTNQITVLWNGPTPGSLQVTESINGTSCSVTTAAFNVTLSTAPTPNITTGSPTACVGSSVNYATALVGGNTYTWTVVGGQITATNLGGVTPTNTISLVGANQITIQWGAAGAGSIALTEASSTNCTVSITPTYAVNINPIPSPAVTGPNTVCGGSTQTYSTPNTAGNTYNWVVAGGTITAGQGTNQVTVLWNATGVGNLTVTESVTGCTPVTTPAYNVTIRPVPAPVVSGPNVVCSSGASSTGAYTTALVAGNTYTWTVTGGNITSGQNTNTINVQWTTAGAGQVSVTEQSTTSCQTIANYAVNVEQTPAPTITGPTVACQNQVGVTYSVPTNANTKLWNVTGGTITAGQGTNQITVTWGAGAGGTVAITETTTGGASCATNVNIAVNLLAPPTPAVTSAQGPSGSIFCQRNLYTFTTTANASRTYTWVVNGGAVVSGQGSNSVQVLWSNSAAGDVQVTEQINGTGCQATSTLYLANLIPSPTQTVTVANNQVCELSNGVTYTAANTPPMGNTIAWTVVGGTIAAGQGTVNLVVNWGASGQGLVIITETATGGNGCSIRDTLRVNKVQQLTPTVQNGLRCGAGSVRLRAFHPSAVGYRWYRQSAPTVALNAGNVADSVWMTPAITANETFLVEALNIGNCAGPKIPVVATVSATNVPATVVANITNVCAGGSNGAISLAISGGVSPYTFVWSNGATTQNLTNIAAGTYSVTITDFGGCITQGTYNVIIDNNQSVQVDAGGDVIIGKGEQIQLQATSTATNIVSYTWTPRLGLNDPNIANPIARPDTTVTYYVEVRNSQGCIGRDSIRVEVTSFNLFVPNTFSPNSDGKNDRFQVFGAREAIQNIEITIFDRLGAVVYRANGTENVLGCDNCQIGWDGTQNGNPLPSGNYVWQLSGKFVNGSNVRSNGKINGTVMLVR